LAVLVSSLALVIQDQVTPSSGALKVCKNL
jgi:hypothetical protein